jgi:hypothetical protein
MTSITRRCAVGAVIFGGITTALTTPTVFAAVAGSAWNRIPVGHPPMPDHIGNLVRIGNHVRLLCAPGLYLDEVLPWIKREALRMVGGSYPVIDFDDEGHVVIEHSWVDAEHVETTIYLYLDAHEFARCLPSPSKVTTGGRPASTAATG